MPATDPALTDQAARPAFSEFGLPFNSDRSTIAQAQFYPSLLSPFGFFYLLLLDWLEPDSAERHLRRLLLVSADFFSELIESLSLLHDLLLFWSLRSLRLDRRFNIYCLSLCG